MTFGFRQPYQVLGDFPMPSPAVLSTDNPLVDSEMCKSTTEFKIDLIKQLGTVLQGEIKPSGCRLLQNLGVTENLTGKPSFSDYSMLHSRTIPSGKVTAARCRPRENFRAKKMQSS